MHPKAFTKIAILFVFLMVFTSAKAFALTLHGALAQGGYVYGTAPRGSQVYLNGSKLEVAADGQFFAGLHRHFPAEGVLKVLSPTGAAETTSFLVVPQTYQTQHITGVPNKMVNPNGAEVARSQKEAAAIRKARSGFRPLPYVFEPFSLPIKNVPLSGVYGSRRTYNGEERNWHKGLDLAAAEGTAVHAPADGIVTGAFPNTFFNGNLVVVDHGYGLYSIYAHLRHIAVTEGQQISRGDVLGEVGQTGRATGPHLHWGVYWHNIALDPKLFLAENERNNL